jgi:hypothetical protein
MIIQVLKEYISWFGGRRAFPVVLHRPPVLDTVTEQRECFINFSSDCNSGLVKRLENENIMVGININSIEDAIKCTNLVPREQ